jgi:hypothetical protein
MASNRNQAEARVAMAREMVEAGLTDSTIARRLQIKYNIVRSTAYLDLRNAHDQIAADDDGPAEHVPDTAGMIAALLLDAQHCQEAGDYKSMAKCIGAANVLKRWGGTDGPDNRFR